MQKIKSQFRDPIATAITVVAFSWVNTKAPLFGNLIAKKDYHQLDQIFNRSLKQSFILVILFTLSAGTGVWLLNQFDLQISHRIIAPLPFAILMLTVIMNNIVISEAVYLRAHKKEPFLWLSLAGGICIGISTYSLGKTFGILAILTGYCTITFFIGLCASSVVFFKKRKQWHQQ